MSLKAMNHVWDTSKQKGNPLLVLLAIADIADDNGDAYPGVTKLAKKCRMTVRNLQKITSKLEAAGELLVFANVGLKTSSGWTNLYRVVMQGVNDQTPLNAPGVSGGSPHEMSRRSPHGVSHGTPKSSDYSSDKSSESDDDVDDFIQWGIAKNLKAAKSTPPQALEPTLRSHYHRLGVPHFQTVIARCKKRNGRSWDYYLNALRDEQVQAQSPKSNPTDPLTGADYLTGEFSAFIQS